MTRPSKRRSAVNAAMVLAFSAFLMVVVTGWFRPESVDAVSGAFALLAVALGGPAAAYTYSEGRRPSEGGGEWSGPGGEGEPR